MAQVDWYVEGVEITNCNCDYGCPCQFEAGDLAAAPRFKDLHFHDQGFDNRLIRREPMFDAGEEARTP